MEKLCYRGVAEYLSATLEKTGEEEKVEAVKRGACDPVGEDFIYRDFADWFRKGGRILLEDSHERRNDFGFSGMRSSYGPRLSEILGLSKEKGREIWSGDNASLYRSSIASSMARDAFRTAFFFLFSFYSNDIFVPLVYPTLYKIKPNPPRFASSFEGFLTLFCQTASLSDQGYGAIQRFLAKENPSLEALWSRLISPSMYNHFLNQPGYWDGYESGTMKSFAIPELGERLTAENRPTFYWDVLMGVITGHRITLEGEKERWSLSFDPLAMKFSISDGSRIGWKADSLDAFLSTPFKGRQTALLLKKAKRAQIAR